MLQHLSIANFALIDSLELDLHEGLSVITGETGAGKSIILGALGLVLGQRSESKHFKNSDKKCIVEASFKISKKQFLPFFTEQDLDFEEITLIRREITPAGKSRAFVNDSPVKLQVLQALSKNLIDIHSQHDSRLLTSPAYQLELVDAFANNEKQRAVYQSQFIILKKYYKELETLQQLASTDVGGLDYLRFQIEELANAKLEPQEQEELEQEVAVLANAEEIAALISEINQLNNSEQPLGLQQALREVQLKLDKIGGYQSHYKQLSERVQSLTIELSDVMMEVETDGSAMDLDPNRLQKVESRLSTLMHLQQKHHVQSNAELIALLDKMNQQLLDVSSIEEKQLKLKETIKEQEALLQIKAAALSTTRKKVAPLLKKAIEKLLAELNMAAAKFEVSLKSNQPFQLNGSDTISFDFSANSGQALQPLQKVASGGELSRVMLALKAIMAQKSDLAAIIFDEIDTGVSGETAHKIGDILTDMGQNMQVIAISHLPQIASKGSYHYKVLKESKEQKTLTQITTLSKEQRLQEVARLLSGEQISAAALANAESLLG